MYVYIYNNDLYIHIYISFKIQHQVAYKTNHIYIYIYIQQSVAIECLSSVKGD